MRRYDEQVQVRRDGAAGEPAHFVWRERLWSVREVVARWVETGAWWEHAVAPALSAAAVGGGSSVADDVRALPDRPGVPDLPDLPDLPELPDLLAEREVWRVRAGRGALGGALGEGVFDLVLDPAEGHWVLEACHD
ncbi:MAG: hypothetical protein CMH83_08460 [Nocardioides sp.]|nr:hypothetical protein [Nocardioides sp.]